MTRRANQLGYHSVRWISTIWLRYRRWQLLRIGLCTESLLTTVPTQCPLLQMDKQNHKLISVGTECVSSTSQRPHHSHDREFISINLSELSVIAEHIQATHPPTLSCHVGEHWWEGPSPRWLDCVSLFFAGTMTVFTDKKYSVIFLS